MWFSDLQIIPVRRDLCLVSKTNFHSEPVARDVPDQPRVDFYQEGLFPETPSLGGAYTCLQSWVTEVGLPPFASWASYWEGFPGGSDGKESASNAGDLGLIPGSGRSPGEGNGSHTGILAWRIPWTGGPGGLWSMGSQRVRRDWIWAQAASHTSELFCVCSHQHHKLAEAHNDVLAACQHSGANIPAMPCIRASSLSLAS